MLIVEWYCVPWHLHEVSFEVVLLSVIGHEDDLGRLFFLIHDTVKFLNQSLGEQSAWWGPVRTIVKTKKVALPGDLILVEFVETDFCDRVIALLALSNQEFIANEILQWVLRFHNINIFLNVLF